MWPMGFPAPAPGMPGMPGQWPPEAYAHMQMPPEAFMQMQMQMQMQHMQMQMASGMGMYGMPVAYGMAPSPLNIDSEDVRHVGKIKSFNKDKGYGFIVCEALKKAGVEKDIFLHNLDIDNFQVGDIVSFNKYTNQHDKPQARNLVGVQLVQPRRSELGAVVNRDLGAFRGVIKFFNSQKGFGFIHSPDLRDHGYQHDVFVQKEELGDTNIGDMVVFDAYLNDNGLPQGKKLRKDVGQQALPLGPPATARPSSAGAPEAPQSAASSTVTTSYSAATTATPVSAAVSAAVRAGTRIGRDASPPKARTKRSRSMSRSRWRSRSKSRKSRKSRSRSSSSSSSGSRSRSRRRR